LLLVLLLIKFGLTNPVQITSPGVVPEEALLARSFSLCSSHESRLSNIWEL